MRWIATLTLLAALVAAPQDGAWAQGRGKPDQEAQKERGAKAQRGEKGPPRVAQEKPERGQGQARGRGEATAQEKSRPQPPGQAGGRQDRRTGQDRARDQARARAHQPERRVEREARGKPAALPAPARRVRPEVARLRASPRRSDRIVYGAFHNRRDPDDDLDVRVVDGRVRVLDRDGRLFLDLDEDEARRLGRWRVRRVHDFDDDDDRRRGGSAPAFCRSGAGHPVWGREWCVDKGFGLGYDRDGFIWGRSVVDDVFFRTRRFDSGDVARAVLVDVLGDVVFDRLALQALTLGATEPLHGVWLADPQGPRILRLHSGDVEVAELVDLNRDDRVDVLYVAVSER